MRLRKSFDETGFACIETDAGVCLICWSASLHTNRSVWQIRYWPCKP